MSSSGTGFARFLHRAGWLKGVPRTGWLDRGVPQAETESVADHSWRTALLAWLAATSDPTLDADRVLQLALVHDLAEALVGDLTPYDGEALPSDPAARAERLSRRLERTPGQVAAKRAAERAAMADLLADLPPAQRSRLESLWAELEARQTPEARFVKEADRLETWLQSREYRAADPALPMGSFDLEVAETIDHPALVDLRGAIAGLEREPRDG